ncbi:hypothetical protein O181_014905 [Austropuccinia psidii MF-1]|uniref:Uncharacterized protein n=1 Tax=Austropuccinia psidii MF-1 TaxID=1389203 RepID=A0A9Q3C1U9_9BASI|nr:hypothetical protein [Austropuccinia psidii MF-1]
MPVQRRSLYPFSVYFCITSNNCSSIINFFSTRAETMLQTTGYLMAWTLVIAKVASHSFILSLEGANGVQASGYGTRLTFRGQLHQNTGIINNQEIKDGKVGPCGRIFGGDDFPPFVIDPHKELARGQFWDQFVLVDFLHRNLTEDKKLKLLNHFIAAEASGIPTVKEDGTIIMGVFVHNPDGAGPFTCEYSSDGSLHSFDAMNITKQIEGDKGVNPAAKDYVYPLTAAFYPNATCTAGHGKNICIMRCRNEVGFGSCAAVKLGAFARHNKVKNSEANQKNQTAEHKDKPKKTENVTKSQASANTIGDLGNKNATNNSQIISPVSQAPPSPSPTKILTFPTIVPQRPPPSNPFYNPLTDTRPLNHNGVERRHQSQLSTPLFLHKKPLHYRGIPKLPVKKKN